MKVFISAERNGGMLNDFCSENSIELIAESLIRFEAVRNEVKHPFDVIFVSSKRSFDYLTGLNVSFENKIFATIGASTAAYLNEKNSRTYFVGSKAGDPQSVALEFKNWLGERRVFFPVSDKSNLSIADNIPEAQKEVVVCYRTIAAPRKIQASDVYVFTSPGNLESFLMMNSIPEGARVIAWGKTTQKALKENGIQVSATLESASDKELVAILKASFL